MKLKAPCQLECGGSGRFLLFQCGPRDQLLLPHLLLSEAADKLDAPGPDHGAPGARPKFAL